MGGQGARFAAIYKQTLHDKAHIALDFHPLGRAVKILMSGQTSWIGTPTELWNELNIIAAGRADVDPDQKGWPGSVGWLGDD